jgi:hypothetical protein
VKLADLLDRASYYDTAQKIRNEDEVDIKLLREKYDAVMILV